MAIINILKKAGDCDKIIDCLIAFKPIEIFKWALFSPYFRHHCSFSLNKVVFYNVSVFSTSTDLILMFWNICLCEDYTIGLREVLTVIQGIIEWDLYIDYFRKKS